MKRILTTVLGLMMIVGTALAAQNSNSKPPAKPKPKVDCSTVTDAQITEDVKARLAKAASLKDLMINVATSAGEVTLTGSAKKATQKGTATRVAKAAACVKKVTNQMTVEGPPPPPPPKPKTANKNM